VFPGLFEAPLWTTTARADDYLAGQFTLSAPGSESSPGRPRAGSLRDCGESPGHGVFRSSDVCLGTKSAVRPGDFNMWGEAGIVGRAFRSNRKSTSNVYV